MGATGLVIEGLAELRQALQNLPAELTAEAGHLIEARANNATRRIKAGYPDGELRDKTTVSFDRSPHGFGAVIRNTSKLATIYERGTQARHYMTSRGNRHLTGRMPAKHVFVPSVMQERRAMYNDLRELLARKGLLVSGDAS